MISFISLWANAVVIY